MKTLVWEMVLLSVSSACYTRLLSQESELSMTSVEHMRAPLPETAQCTKVKQVGGFWPAELHHRAFPHGCYLCCFAKELREKMRWCEFGVQTDFEACEFSRPRSTSEFGQVHDLLRDPFEVPGVAFESLPSDANQVQVGQAADLHVEGQDGAALEILFLAAQRVPACRDKNGEIET